MQRKLQTTRPHNAIFPLWQNGVATRRNLIGKEGEKRGCAWGFKFSGSQSLALLPELCNTKTKNRREQSLFGLGTTGHFHHDHDADFALAPSLSTVIGFTVFSGGGTGEFCAGAEATAEGLTGTLESGKP